MARQIAIVDGDAAARALLYDALSTEGYEVRAWAEGTDLVETLGRTACDLLLIDVDLCGTDGFALVRTLRERFDIAIIIVSARTAPADRIVGLDLGADDYVAKPFDPVEMLARIRSVLRRRPLSGQLSGTSPATPPAWLAFDGWRLNVATRTLRDNAGHTIALTTGEYRLLEALVRNAGRILSRAQLIEAMHESGPPTDDRSIDVGIMRLRKKLADDVENPRLIKTVRNGGYLFMAAVSAGRATSGS